MNTSDYQRASKRLRDLSQRMQIEVMKVRVKPMLDVRPRRILMTITDDDYISMALENKRKIMKEQAELMEKYIFRPYFDAHPEKMNGIYPVLSTKTLPNGNIQKIFNTPNGIHVAVSRYISGVHPITPIAGEF